MTSSARSSLIPIARVRNVVVLVGRVLLDDPVAGLGLDAGLLGVVDAARQIAVGSGGGASGRASGSGGTWDSFVTGVRGRTLSSRWVHSKCPSRAEACQTCDDSGATPRWPGIIATMTERGQPSLDGSPACPFVAFEDDRDARADRPDHRHRCFAEPDPAPRALAHQEAYCLSSAFPVCPTFQAWARREAAQAKADRGGADAPSPTSAEAASAAGGAAGAVAAGDVSDGRDGTDGIKPDDGRPTSGGAEEWSGGRPDDDIPLEARPRRNPPRDWAAPPPWATGAGAAGAAGTSGGGSAKPPSGDAARPSDAPDVLAPRSVEGQGLAGSSADRLASGEPIEEVMAPSNGGAVAPPVVPATPTRSGDHPSSAPDPELAGLVGGTAAARSVVVIERPQRIGPGRAGRRPRLSAFDAKRPTPLRQLDPDPAAESEGSVAPPRARPTRRPVLGARATLRGLPDDQDPGGLRRLRRGARAPRVAILAGALGIAALALFFLPALLGVGGGGGGASPSPSATAQVTAPPSPTPEPAPTPQVYMIKEGDTLSKIAKRNDITLDQLLAANKDTIKDWYPGLWL